MKILKESQDAQGRAMLDYLNGEKVSEIIERDDGYLDVSNGPASYFTQYKNWAGHEKQAVKYVKGRVLDVGCGAGRHSLYLQNKRYDVLGIDISPYSIKICKKRGLKHIKLLPVTQATMKLGKFDTILLLGNNFGLMENLQRGKWLLKRFSGITNERAIIIAETLDPYNTKEERHLRYHKLNLKRNRLPGQTRLRVRYHMYKTPWFDYLLVSKTEMQMMLKRTGWSVKKYIDSKGPVYIAVIEKQ